MGLWDILAAGAGAEPTTIAAPTQPTIAERLKNRLITLALANMAAPNNGDSSVLDSGAAQHAIQRGPVDGYAGQDALQRGPGDNAAGQFATQQNPTAATGKQPTARDSAYSAASKQAAENISNRRKAQLQDQFKKQRPSNDNAYARDRLVNGYSTGYIAPGNPGQTNDATADSQRVRMGATDPQLAQTANMVEAGLNPGNGKMSPEGRKTAMRVLSAQDKAAEEARLARQGFVDGATIFSGPVSAQRIQEFRNRTAGLPSGMVPARNSDGSYDERGGAVPMGTPTNANRVVVDPAVVAANKAKYEQDAAARLRYYTMRNVAEAAAARGLNPNAAVQSFMAGSPGVATSGDVANGQKFGSIVSNPAYGQELQAETERQKSLNQSMGLIGGQAAQSEQPGGIGVAAGALKGLQDQQRGFTSPSGGAANPLDAILRQQMQQTMTNSQNSAIDNRNSRLQAAYDAVKPGFLSSLFTQNVPGLTDRLVGMNAGDYEIGSTARRMLQHDPTLNPQDVIGHLRGVYGDYGRDYENGLLQLLTGQR